MTPAIRSMRYERDLNGPIDERGCHMGYLFLKLLPWIVCALALGIAMGWVACKPGEQERD